MARILGDSPALKLGGPVDSVDCRRASDTQDSAGASNLDEDVARFGSPDEWFWFGVGNSDVPGNRRLQVHHAKAAAEGHAFRVIARL